MPITPSPHAVDPGGVLHLRPRSSTVLCLIVWAPILILCLDAVIRAGWEGVRALPIALIVGVAVWALLWSPRLVLREDRVEVRNIVISHELPFVAIERVRIGAMVRFDVLTADRREKTFTAWNAPALKRDRVRTTRQGGRIAVEQSAPQRLLADQAACRSTVVRTRWENWQDRNEGAPFEPARTRPRWVVIAVILLSIAMLLGSIAL